MIEEKKDNTNSEKKAQSKSQKDMNTLIGGLVFGMLFAFAAYQIHIKFGEFAIGQILTYVTGFFAFMCFMVSLNCFFDYKESKRIEKLEEDAHQEEKEFFAISSEERAARAEKMFRMNQKELMRYYDMNLAQMKFLSWLGIMMIIFGILIAIASLHLYISFDSDKILLLVGSSSGIIVDFIGTIFIKMYTKNIEAAIKFHSKFAESNNLLLANSIANKIDDVRIREETLAEMSKSIILTSKSPKK